METHVAETGYLYNLVSLTVLLTACDSSKQSETDTDAKSSVFKTEQAEVYHI